ncbi:ABC transporter permease [Streptomyces hirsutus]
MIISGGLAGLGGAFLSIVANPFYLEGQVSGRGYIGLAAMIFGNWMPGGLAIGAGLFGYTDSLNLRGGSTNVHALLLLGALLLLAGAIWLAIRKRVRARAVITLVVGALVFAWYAGTNEVPDQVVAASVRHHPGGPRPVRPAAAHAEADGLPYRKGQGG